MLSRLGTYFPGSPFRLVIINVMVKTVSLLSASLLSEFLSRSPLSLTMSTSISNDTDPLLGMKSSAAKSLFLTMTEGTPLINWYRWSSSSLSSSLLFDFALSSSLRSFKRREVSFFLAFFPFFVAKKTASPFRFPPG